MASGLDEKTENRQAWSADFYGTITETLESGEMKRHALERVRALHSNLEEKDVKIHAAQIPGSAMVRVEALSGSGKYARVFLDALLDEFLSFRQAVREQRGEKELQKLSQEALKAQKVMEESAGELADFQRFNNFISLTSINNQAAASLAKIHTQLEEQRTILEEEELAMRNIPAAWTIAQTRVSTDQPLTQTEKDYVQAQSELRRLENELKYLLGTHKPEDAVVVETKEKAAKARFLFNALIDPLQEEMTQRTEGTRRKVSVLERMLTEKQGEALDIGKRIAQQDKLERQAKAAKEAYDKLCEQVKLNERLAENTDFVAIQERAQPATEVMQSGLIPVWRLWKSEPKLPAEESTPKPAPKKKEPAKAAG